MKYIVVFALMFIFGCASGPLVEKLTANRYKLIMPSGHSSDDEKIKSIFRAKAIELCGGTDFEFEKDWLGNEIGFGASKHLTPRGNGKYSDGIALQAVTKIKCLNND